MRSYLVAAVLICAASAASAQTVNFVSGSRTPAPNIMRVQVQLQLTSRLSTAASPDEQLAAQEELRRSLYTYVAKECAVLGDAFKAECRMSALNLSSNVNPRGMPGSEIATVSGNATYELSPKAAQQ